MAAIPSEWLDDEAIRAIYRKKVIAVVGISRDPSKAAGYVPEYLLEQGYNVIPVNPFAGTIMGRKCYKTIADVPVTIDVVDVFRPSDEAAKVVEDAVAKGVKTVWLQEGIFSPEAAAKARAADITIVWNRCIMKEHRRLFGAVP